MQSAKGWPGRGRAGSIAGAKCTRAYGWNGWGFGARWGRLGVEENRLGHALDVILSNDDAAVARVLEVDLWQRSVMPAPWRQRGSMQRVGLAVRMVEGARLGIEQVARVALFGGRVEDGRGPRVGSGPAFAAAEEVSDHVWQRERARSSMGTGSWS